ncbi:MAG: hypothetical protein V1820_02705 [archaeon]
MVTTNAPDGKFKLRPLKEKSDDVLEAGLVEGVNEKIAFFQTTVLDKMPAVEWILDSFREGNRAILIDIRPLRAKKGEELRRAVDRLKLQVEKTGNIMQLDENWLLLMPAGIKLLS